MHVAHNKGVVRRLYEDVVGRGDLSAVALLIATDYVDHNAKQAGTGPTVLRTHVMAVRSTFPDFTLRIDDMVAEGDLVVTRVSGQGTHLGKWMNIEPSGACVTVRGINIDRLRGGQVIEHWGEADTVGMPMQMGVDVFASAGREALS